MISIIEHIEYLMTCNDCVVIPGWGAFIAQYSSSHFPMGSSLVEKPVRKISFNASIAHNDGLLASSIAKKHGISFSDAVKELDSNVSVYRQLIVEGTEIPFGRLGYFASTTDGRIEFVPFYQEQSVDKFFGLHSFNFKTLQQLQNEASEASSVAEIECAEENITEQPFVPYYEPSTSSWFSKRFLKIAASIIVLIGMVAVLSTPIVFNRQQQEFASVNVPDIKKQSSSTPVIPKEKSERANIEKQTSATTVKTEAVTDKTVKPVQNEGKYKLVICTLTSQKQVNKFFKYNKNLVGKANVSVKRGKYRIYIDSSDDMNELVKKSKNLPKPFTQAWIAKD